MLHSVSLHLNLRPHPALEQALLDAQLNGVLPDSRSALGGDLHPNGELRSLADEGINDLVVEILPMLSSYRGADHNPAVVWLHARLNHWRLDRLWQRFAVSLILVSPFGPIE